MTAYTRSGTEPARAGIVAGLRALADLLETHPELPVPDNADTQHTVAASDLPGYENRLAAVRAHRDLMVRAGLKVSELAPGAIEVHVSKYPARATYTVYAAEETRAEKERKLQSMASVATAPVLPPVAPPLATQCASELVDDADHTHRCALHVEDGPHNDSNHICATCDKQWGGA